MKLIVEGMTCGRCIRKVTDAVQKLDASALVHIDLENQEVSIVGNVDVASAIKAIQDEGYMVVVILEAGSSSASNEEEKALDCCGTCHS
jgi:copper chaperone